MSTDWVRDDDDQVLRPITNIVYDIFCTADVSTKTTFL